MAFRALCVLLCGAATATHQIALERRESLAKINATDFMLVLRSRRKLHQASALWSWVPMMGASELTEDPLDDKAHASTEIMQNVQNLQYLGKVYVGDPAQEVKLVFDTGSSDLWVSNDRFNCDVSDTWEPTDYQVTIHYGSGIVSGYYALDRACLDASPPLCVYRQPLFLATDILGINMVEMDGLVGLGFIGISHVHHTFLRNLNESFEDMSFAFKLTQYQGGDPSYVIFGNYDQVMKQGFEETGISHHQVLFAPVLDLFRIPDMQGLQAGWWLVKATSKVHGHEMNPWKLRGEYFILEFFDLLILAGCIFACDWLKNYWDVRRARYPCFVSICWFFSAFCCVLGIAELLLWLYHILTAGTYEPQTIYAALDTGTSLISIPLGDFEYLALAMFGDHYWFSCSVQTGTLLCLCEIQDEVKPMGFEIGGKDIWLRPSEMFFEVGTTPDNKKVCMTGLSENLQPIWILGDVFLRQAYVVHNFNRREVALFPYHPGKAPAEKLLESVGPLRRCLVLAAGLAAVASALAASCRRVPARSSGEEPLLQPEEVPRDFLAERTGTAR